MCLHCLSRPFWQATSVLNFRTFTVTTDGEEFSCTLTNKSQHIKAFHHTSKVRFSKQTFNLAQPSNIDGKSFQICLKQFSSYIGKLMARTC